MKTILLDIDDTIANTKETFREIMNRRTGKSVSAEEWVNYDLTQIYDGVSSDDIRNFILEENMLNRIEPLENTRATVDYLKNSGYNIAYITSRAYAPDAKNITENWLKRHGIHYDAIHISGSGILKSMYANLYHNVALVVDDHSYNTMDFYTNCPRIKNHNNVVVRQTWNKEFLNEHGSRFIMINDISDIKHLL